jgi:hypothetical protein
VGGSFTGLLSTATNMLSNVARYNIAQGTWNPLHGVNVFTFIFSYWFY